MSGTPLPQDPTDPQGAELSKSVVFLYIRATLAIKSAFAQQGLDTLDAQNLSLVHTCEVHVQTVTGIGHLGCSEPKPGAHASHAP